MRILILSWEYPPYVVGGLGKHVEGLIPVLDTVHSRYGALHVDVLTTRNNGGEPVQQLNSAVTIHRLEMPPIDAPDLYTSVSTANEIFVSYAQQLMQRYHYDAIHVHDWLTGTAGLRLKNDTQKPLITTIHATERGRHQGNLCATTSRQIDELECRLCHEAWRVVVCSHYMTTELRSSFGIPGDKIVVIPNGVDYQNAYRCSPAQRESLRKRYAPQQERLLFFVGRIVHEKGLHILLQAMPHILADFPDTRLLVAGKNGRRWQPYAAELRVDYAVRFLDFISDQERDSLYQVVDAAVFPSLYEPFGIVALEAMAMGCNVIASDVGGLSEVIKHQVNGLTIFPNDPNSIAWAVRQLFLDSNAADVRKARALAEVQELYSWKKIAQQTATLYDSVIAECKLAIW